MEDTREALGTLSEKFKAEFLRIFNSPRNCELLQPAEPEDPEDIPLILHRPQSKKNKAISFSIDKKNVNFRDLDGNTLLHLAVINFHPKRAKNQLKIITAIKHANTTINPNVQNQNRQTPLDLAASQDTINFDLIDALIKKDDQYIVEMSASSDNLKKLLHEAILQGRPDSVKNLLKIGANPRAADDQGKIALHYAVENHPINEQIIRHLEDFMKDDYVGQDNMKGANLLHIVALEGITGVAEHLVDFYDINSEMENGTRPIVLAINKPKIVKDLINAGAQPWNWTAYKVRKPSKQEMRGVYSLLKEIKKEHSNSELKFHDKDPAVQSALFNLIAYTGKLKSELDNRTFITNTYHLPEKYGELKTLVRELLTETNPDIFNAKLSAALNNNTLTENRSKFLGFYKLHGIFSRKRNTVNPNQKHFVKSTTEELLYDLKNAMDTALNKSQSPSVTN